MMMRRRRLDAVIVLVMVAAITLTTLLIAAGPLSVMTLAVDALVLVEGRRVGRAIVVELTATTTGFAGRHGGRR